MKKTIRKNFRFSELDMFMIGCIRDRLSYSGASDSQVIRTCISYAFEAFCRDNLNDLEQDAEICIFEKMYGFSDYSREDSGAINFSPALIDRLPDSLVERYRELKYWDDELPF